jgi:hypothetical protein
MPANTVVTMPAALSPWLERWTSPNARGYQARRRPEADDPRQRLLQIAAEQQRHEVARRVAFQDPIPAAARSGRRTTRFYFATPWQRRLPAEGLRSAGRNSLVAVERQAVMFPAVKKSS